MKLLSRVCLLGTPWTGAHQAPLSMEFSRKEYWSGLPFPSPGDLPDPGIEHGSPALGSPALQADALPPEPSGRGHSQIDLFKTQKQKQIQNQCAVPGRRLPLGSERPVGYDDL